MRVSSHLRSELFPYIYTSAAQSARETVPLDRPLYIDHPREEKSYHNAQEYQFGDNLLVAPIVTAGVGQGRVASQTVWFPSGTWFNYFTGERYVGSTSALVAADMDEFPLYVRGGVPVPMQPYTPRMGTAPLTTLRVRCYPGADGQTGRSTLYEDDGVTTAYERGQSATTPLTYTRYGSAVTITVGATRGHYAGQPARRSVIIELPDTARATKATLGGKPLAVDYDRVRYTNKIAVPAVPIGKAVAVIVQAAPGGWNGLGALAGVRRIAGVSGVAAKVSTSSLSSLQDMMLAAMGVGLVHKNEGTYLDHGTVRDLFYAPRGLLDGNQVQIVGRGTVALPLSGAPLEVTGPPHTWRGRTVFAPAQISFRMAGVTWHLPAVPPPDNELTTEDNVAGTAKVTASGAEGGYSAEGAVDGVVGGYPNDKSQEWSAGSTVGATLTLTWATPQTIDRILLYDRPNTTDQITSGEIAFSDGTTLPVGALPDDAKTPLTLRFPAKTVTSLTFRVTGVKAGTQNAGLAEIAVFRGK